MAAHYFGTIENNVTGKPVMGASIAVLSAPSASAGTELTIYSDDGITGTDNPLTTDSYGYYEFWVNEDSGTLEISFGSYTKVIEDVSFLGGAVSGDVTTLQVRMDQAESDIDALEGQVYTDEMARDAIATTLVAGSNVTITPNDGADTITIAATGGGGSGAWHLQWGPLVNEPPATNYATLDTRNSHAVLDFDTTTQEAAIFSGCLPAGYGGNGVTIHIYCSLTSATSGTIGWDVAFERMDASTLDIDADSFATATTVTAVTVPGTSGMLLKMSVNISNGTNMDSLAAGEMFRLRIRRDVANDTAAGDAELLRVMMVEQ